MAPPANRWPGSRDVGVPGDPGGARSETWRDQRERRFRLHPDKLSQVLAELGAHVPQVSYAPGSTQSIVITTYLDSPERAYLAMVEESAGHLSRKLRIREYLPVPGEPAVPLSAAATCFLERKERVGELRVKQRIQLLKRDVARVLRNEMALLGDELVVDALRAELDALALEPVLVTSYRRRVFGSDRALRVTVDQEIYFHRPPEALYAHDRALTPEELGPPAARGPAYLLEVKEPKASETPGWLAALVGNLEPAAQFSKFRDGMRSLGGGVAEPRQLLLTRR